MPMVLLPMHKRLLAELSNTGVALNIRMIRGGFFMPQTTRKILFRTVTKKNIEILQRKSAKLSQISTESRVLSFLLFYLF